MRDPTRERERTDDSLDRERSRTDHELATRSEAAGEAADEVIKLARERARAVIETARAREASHGPLAPEVLLARAAEDALVAYEDEAADLALRDERERRRLAIRQLLALERRATDATLMLERAAVDDSMVERRMIDMLVHDMRTMLSVIAVNAATIILATEKSAPVSLVVELAAHIQHATAQSDILLGDLQELAAFEGGRARVVRTDADLLQVVRTAIDIHEAVAEANGIALTATLPEGPLVVPLDTGRFMRVVVNLLTNALKFTPRGGSVTVEVTRGERTIELAVKDTGPGIPHELHEAIFERFRRGPDVTARGLGLGLYIARALVEAHGGSISVESSPGTGATFRVRLPAPI